MIFHEQLIKHIFIWVLNITIKYKLQLKMTFSFNFFIRKVTLIKYLNFYNLNGADVSESFHMSSLLLMLMDIP